MHIQSSCELLFVDNYVTVPYVRNFMKLFYMNVNWENSQWSRKQWFKFFFLNTTLLLILVYTYILKQIYKYVCFHMFHSFMYGTYEYVLEINGSILALSLEQYSTICTYVRSLYGYQILSIIFFFRSDDGNS